jgi:hypothetical protein
MHSVPTGVIIAEVNQKFCRPPRLERSAAAGLTAMALRRRPTMSKYKNAFDEGEDFTAEDMEEFLAPKYLTSTALGNRKLRLTISKVKKREFPSEGGGTEVKPVLHFADSSQPLRLNNTNLRTLSAELGDPQTWPGAVIGVSTDPTVKFNGIAALRVKVLNAPTAKPGPNGPGSDDQV